MAKLNHRVALTGAKRVVVKVGSRVLVQSTGRPDRRRMKAVVADLAALHHGGREVVLVTSGAVGAGMEALGLKSRPTTIPDLQMAAAVGQSRLMTEYSAMFAARKCRIGQMLLTHDDLKHRQRHLNARNTLMNLLRHGIIPVINENDVVAIDEIKFGDNDMLAALVSILIPADLLVLLSTTDGFREPAGAGRTRRVSCLATVSADVKGLAKGRGGELSTGGMATKLDAAQTAANDGIPVVIADGRRAGTVCRILAGDDVGTLLEASAHREGISGRKRWIAFFHKTQGTLVLDAGAVDAVLAHGKSLLPIGIRAVEGEFSVGAQVNICGPDLAVIARGLADYSSSDIRRIQGKRSDEIAKILGSKDYDEVVHRDNMVLVGP